MSRPHGPGLLFQTQNMDIQNEGVAVKKMNNNISKTSQKKGAGNRKALQDLSNSGLLYQTQNLDIHKEGSLVKKTSDGMFKANQKKPLQILPNSQNRDICKGGSVGNKLSEALSKTSQKKGGVGRKALQDVSNSLSLRQEAARKENKLSWEEHNIAEERCLHNSNQCTAAWKAEMDLNIYDTVLFEQGLLHRNTSPLLKENEISSASPQKHLELEPIPELPISPEIDCHPSPIQLDSPLPPASVYKLPELEKSMPRAAGVEQTSDIHGPAVDTPNSASLCYDELQNIKQEGFLHDHKKCMEGQRAQMDQDLYDALLFEHGLLNEDASLEMREPEMVTIESPPLYLLDEVPELPMPAIADWCPSPVEFQSPPFSPSRYELPELMLKPCYIN